MWRAIFSPMNEYSHLIGSIFTDGQVLYNEGDLKEPKCEENQRYFDRWWASIIKGDKQVLTCDEQVH